ncbi:hypothetical protein IGI37_001367 [Enterococcus sp. AZ194]|uniref:SpaA isopeptide-forming pilin-related protein n=1 Tax=Enterococcus sp. AZ194 TaxID=2774629 RepID=UPI003F1FAA22
MRKKLIQSFYVLASMIMVVAQLGIVNVFAVTDDPMTPKISISNNKVTEGTEFSVEVTAPEAQLSQVELIYDSSMEEVSRKALDSTHSQIILKATVAGEYDIYGQTAGGQTNTLHVSVVSQESSSTTESSVISNQTSVSETSEVATTSSENVNSSTIETSESTDVSSDKTNQTSSTETMDTKETSDSSKPVVKENKDKDGSTVNPQAVGDDPGIVLTAPDSITTNQNVELDITLQGSAGKLNENGTIHVTIPKEIVRNASSLSDPTNYTIGGPFSLGNPIYTDDGKGHYVVTINYEANKIDQSEAFGALVKIHFQAPLIREDMPDQTFSADMTQGRVKSHSEDSSEIIKTEHNEGIFFKWSPNKRKDIEGVNAAIMDQNNSYRNIFAISVNYTQQNLHNVIVKDVFPEGTSLADSNTYQDASGDSSILKHLRVLKVTSTDVDGTPNSWVYVTKDFANKIKLVDNGFEVDFGDLTPDDSYELVYGLSVDEVFTGTKQNAATLTSDEHNKAAHEIITLDDDEFQNVTLLKNVDQHGLTSTEGSLNYTLDLHAKAGTVAKGTKIEDPLVSLLTNPHNFIYDATQVTAPVYDQTTNTLSYKLLKDMQAGDHVVVKFETEIDKNGGLQAGDKITNKASFDYNGTNIYSNDASTAFKNSVILRKVDSKTGEPLAGAVFEIKDDSGKVLKSVTTNAKGTVDVGLLKPGEYTAAEVTAPAGYILDTTPQSFKVVVGMNTAISVKFEDTLTPGGVELMKKDAKSGEGLQGAVFELQNAGGITLQSGLITDASGLLTINDLEPGDYQLIETQAPTGYDLDATPVPFTVEKGQTTVAKVSMTNKLTPGGVVLTKTDETTKDALQGAVFELQDKDGTALQSGLTTDVSGKIAVDGLAPGDYQFVETQAPTGYDLDKTPVTFTIEKGQTQAVQVSMTNKLTPGGVVLTKTDETTKDALQGAVFELQDKAGKALQSGLTTDVSGKIAVDGLAPGDYQFVETQAPVGYDLDKTPVKFTIEKGQKEVVQVSMTNKLTPGGVVLVKKDATSGEALQGAVFELQDKAGKALQSGLTTDASGKIAVDGLAPGDYQFVEMQAPTGYDLDATPITFTIEKGQTQAVQVSMTNKLTPGGVVLTKTDATSGEALQGAVFELQDKAGKALQSGLTTDVSGKIAVDGLAPGDYQFVETQAPTGYDLDKTPVVFTIKKGQTEAVQVSMTNSKTKGSVILQKYDKKTGNVLSGAVFELQDENHKVLLSDLKTDQSGKISVKEMTPGTYYFVETKAPEGYKIDKTPIKFVVKGKEESTTVKMDNEGKTHALKVIKKDVDSKVTLKGAVFSLFDKDGKEIKSGLTTNEDGTFSVEDLAVGAYYLKETKAPKGYKLDTRSIPFKIAEDSELITLDVYNVKEKGAKPSLPKDNSHSTKTLPKTGEKHSISMSVVGGILLIVALGIGYYVKRKIRK